MKNVLAQAIIVIACLCMSTTTKATVVRMESLNWVQFGPHGELLVAGSMGAMLSVDGGKTWTSPVGARMNAPDDPSSSVQQIAKQRNLTWPGLQWPFVRSAVDNQGRIYRCTSNSKVEYSDNHGKDWIRAVMVTDGAEEYPCHIVSTVANVPYVLSDQNIYWSEDRGQHWKQNHHALGASLRSDVLRLIKIFGDSSGVLYVNHNLPSVYGDQHIKIQRSKNQGASWEQLAFALPTQQALGTVALLKIHEDALYFVAQADRLGEPASLYRSTDGRTATKLLDIPAEPLCYMGLRFFDIGPHGELAVAAAQSLFISNDRGDTWKTISKDRLWKGPWITHT